MIAEGFIDPEALDRSVAALGEQIKAKSLSDALQALLATTRVLFDAAGAGVMFVDDGSMLHAVAATDEAGRLLELRQEETGKGPCVDALVLNRVVSSGDLADDPRWPKLSSELSAEGVRAVLGVPVHANSVTVGSLNVYRDTPHDWDKSEIHALEAYARLVESVLASALQAEQYSQLAEQLQHALDNRVLIERAVGVVMGRDSVDAVTAFNRIRRTARSSGRKAVDVAAELLAGIPAAPSAD
jgi:GAF domain-containing protein